MPKVNIISKDDTVSVLWANNGELVFLALKENVTGQHSVVQFTDAEYLKGLIQALERARRKAFPKTEREQS